MERFSRTENLIGTERAEKLYAAKVAVFGLGGVGGYVVEALARAGVGTLLIVDGDVVAESNINRQIVATVNTVGMTKVAAFENRIKEINPDCIVIAKNLFFTAENADEIDFSGYDYVVDAIDTVTSKLEIVKRAKAQGVSVICAMGAGNKLYTDFKIADVSKTTTCPLARVMRRELKGLGISGVKAAFSDELPLSGGVRSADTGKQIPASISYVPGAMGLTIAGEVIRDIAGIV